MPLKKLFSQKKNKNATPTTPNNQELSVSGEGSTSRNTLSPLPTVNKPRSQKNDPLDFSSPDRTEKYGLFPMTPTDSSLNVSEVRSDYLLDIVAIHGITGDAYDTWTHENGCLWIRDWLPQDLPGARVWSFGYDAMLWSRSQGNIESFARSLLNSLTRERMDNKVENDLLHHRG